MSDRPSASRSPWRRMRREARSGSRTTDSKIGLPRRMAVLSYAPVTEGLLRTKVK